MDVGGLKIEVSTVVLFCFFFFTSLVCMPRVQELVEMLSETALGKHEMCERS